MDGQLLDPIPVPAFFILFAIVGGACYEIGFRVGRWWQDREPGEQEGPTDMLVGSLLALMAFLLAVTMGMASDRFDSRRGLVLEEANAIETAFLRAGYLPQPARDQARELLRTYLPLRIVSSATSPVSANIQRGAELQDEMWAIEEEVASVNSSDLIASFGESLTEIVNVGQSRITAALYTRVPGTVLWLLIAGSMLTLGMVGYSAGLKRRRSVLSAAVVVIALGAVLTLVIDIDRPREGFVTVSQQPLLDVQQRIGQPPSP